MSEFQVFTCLEGRHYRHRKAEEKFFLQLLDESAEPVGLEYCFDSDGYDLATHHGLRRLAVSDDSDRSIKIYSWGETEPERVLKRPAYSAMLMSNSGENLYFKSKGGHFRYRIGADTLERFTPQVEQFNNGLRVGSEWLMPARRKGQILSLHLETGELTTIELEGVNFTFFRLLKSPTEHLAACIGKKKTIVWLDLGSFEVKAMTDLRKAADGAHVGAGGFCGDGSLLGLTASYGNRNDLLILDAQQHEYSHRLETVCYQRPYEGTCVRDASTVKNSFNFRFVDLASGQVGTASLRAD